MVSNKKIGLQILEIVSKNIFLQRCHKKYTVLVGTDFGWFVGWKNYLNTCFKMQLLYSFRRSFALQKWSNWQLCDLLFLPIKSIHLCFRTRLEELRMFLENETWELCPVKSSFSILQLHVRSMNKTYKCINTCITKSPGVLRSSKIRENVQMFLMASKSSSILLHDIRNLGVKWFWNRRVSVSGRQRYYGRC